jgi:ribosomal protein S18 acetylase RimI-like enzyme
LPSVVDIKIKGWKCAYKGIIDDKYLDNLNNEYETMIKKMEQNYMTNGFIIAEANGEVVGFCRYIFDNSFSPELENADCELCAMYVREDLKYYGIGTKMFRFVVNKFKEKNKTKMILWCLKDNEPAKKFYIKMGGKIIKERKVNLGDKQYQECCFEYDITNKSKGSVVNVKSKNRNR